MTTQVKLRLEEDNLVCIVGLDPELFNMIFSDTEIIEFKSAITTFGEVIGDVSDRETTLSGLASLIEMRAHCLTGSDKEPARKIYYDAAKFLRYVENAMRQAMLRKSEGRTINFESLGLRWTDPERKVDDDQV